MIIATILGIILHVILYFYLNDTSIFINVLYHYNSLNIIFLISLTIQIYWLYILYLYTYQYLEIDQFMNIRLTYKQKLYFYMKKFIIFSLHYLLFQFILALFISQYSPIIYYNLIIYFICFIITLFTKKENVMIIMLIIMIILKLI